MLLVIDVGNSNTEFGVFHGKEILAKWRISTKLSTVDELALELFGFMSLNSVKPEAIRGCVLSSVVPALTTRMGEVSEKFFSLTPLVVNSKTRLPIKICYDNPEEVGADRIVNAVAAFVEYKKSSIIIDFGTATTFCVVTSTGDYLGGCIMPGIQISLDALFDKAAKLHRVRLKKPNKVIGKNTTESIQSGTFFGYISMIEGLVNRIKAEACEDLFVIGTGGLSYEIAKESSIIDIQDSELTLKGLKSIFDFAA